MKLETDRLKGHINTKFLVCKRAIDHELTVGETAMLNNVDSIYSSYNDMKEKQTQLAAILNTLNSYHKNIGDFTKG